MKKIIEDNVPFFYFNLKIIEESDYHHRYKWALEVDKPLYDKLMNEDYQEDLSEYEEEMLNAYRILDEILDEANSDLKINPDSEWATGELYDNNGIEFSFEEIETFKECSEEENQKFFNELREIETKQIQTAINSLSEKLHKAFPLIDISHNIPYGHIFTELTDYYESIIGAWLSDILTKEEE